MTGEDVGTSPEDMALVRLETPYVGGLAHGSGDPSPYTAHGVFRAMQAAAVQAWGSGTLSGRRVAIQGCGHVGYQLALELHKAGAQLTVADIEAENVRRVVDATGAKSVAPGEIFDVEADVFAPCALGGILNDATIPRLRVSMVCGAANNQLAGDRHGRALAGRKILYVPDYVANAGGIINGVRELGADAMRASAPDVETIYATTTEVLDLARAHGIPPSEAADQLAQVRLQKP